MSTIIFGGHFIASKAGKTGLADVTVRITRITLADLTLNALVTDAACTEDTASAKGGYLYRLANADLSTYAYAAYMTTADATVDQKTVAAMQELVGADILAILGSVLSETVAGYLAAGLKKLLDVAAPVFTLASANQIGDSYARLGAPAGASVSADIAAIPTTAAPTAAAVAAAVWAYTTRSLTSFGTLIADIWSNATRTLTQGAASVEDAVAGDDVTQYLGADWDVTLTGLPSDVTTYSKVYVTIKKEPTDPDSAAVVQWEKSAGLKVFNAKSGSDIAPANGALTTPSATSVRFTLKAVESVKLQALTMHYDVKGIAPTTGLNVVLSEGGKFTTKWAITRAIT